MSSWLATALGLSTAARDELDLLCDALTSEVSLASMAPELQDRVIASAEKHGVAPLLPMPQHPRLQQLTAASRARFIRALRFTRRATDALEAARVPCVVLKGVAAGARWVDPTVRQQSDCDLLVARDDLDRASATLIAAGVSKERFYEGKHGHNAALTAAQPTGLTIELHHALSSHYAMTVSVTELLSRRTSLVTAQGPVPALAAEDDAAYLAMHAATHALQRLAWLVDLAVLRVDWVEAARRAVAWGVAAPVALAWHETRARLKVPIPAAAFEALGVSAAQRLAMQQLLRASRATEGQVHRGFDIALRTAFVSPLDWPAVLWRKVLAKREEDAAYERVNRASRT